jgi:hypothetical protein
VLLQEDMGEEDMLGALLPFQFMLQIMLAPLLQPGSGEPAAAALPLILKIGRTLKRTEDGGVSGFSSCLLLVLLPVASLYGW